MTKIKSLKEDKGMIKLRNMVEASLILADSFCDCKDCLENECPGFRVRRNLRRALKDIPDYKKKGVKNVI